MKKTLRLLLAAAFALCATAASAAYTISVETFRNSTPHYVPVDTIVDMMTTELVNSGTFQVVERSRLDAVAREQNLASSGMVDSRSAAQSGRLAGAQYIMTGAVTKYSHSGAGGGGVVGNRHSRHGLLGGVIGTSTAYVTLDVRIIDSTTGAIVYAGRAEGAGTNVMGGLLSRYGGFGTGSGGGQLATAAHKAVTKVIANLRAAIGAGAAPGNSEGNHVLEFSGGSVTIDAGSTNAGARRGQFYAVYREGDLIRDLHGNILDAEREYIAVIKITDARPQYSKARLVRGSGIKRGDAIEPIRRADSVRLRGE